MSGNTDVIRTQNVLFKMAKVISEILDSHKVPHMLAYGTLLGAVRHKGFIPWDDDFDFYLFDDTYDKGIEVLRNELPVDMFLEDEKSEPLYFHGWAHVKDLHSEAYNTQFSQDGFYSHKGISIDLYRTKKMKLSQLEPFLNNENRKYIERRKAKGLISDEEYNSRLAKLAENEQAAKNIVVEEDFDVFNLVPLYKCHYIKATAIFPLKKYTFLDTQFWGPFDAHDFLSNVYGNYMEYPPVEKRTQHYSSVVFHNTSEEI